MAYILFSYNQFLNIESLSAFLLYKKRGFPYIFHNCLFYDRIVVTFVWINSIIAVIHETRKNCR